MFNKCRTGLCSRCVDGASPRALPSLIVKLTDPLSMRQFAALVRDPVFRGRGVPHGDGRPVLLIPGFLSGDWHLGVLHNWLGRIGYRPYLSGILFNVQHSEKMLSGLRRRLTELNPETALPVSIVGHSRGAPPAND